jgi:hypothetical protein
VAVVDLFPLPCVVVGRIWGLLGAVIALVVAAVPAAQAAVPPPVPKAEIVGDSLAVEARATVTDATVGASYKLVYTATIGRAPCDYIKALGVPTKRLTLLVIETAGNSHSKCMIDPDTGTYYVQGSDEFKAKYRADMNKLFALTQVRSALRIVVVAPPPFSDPVLESFYSDVFPVLAADAASYDRISFSTATRDAVSDDGAYAQQLPCLTSETCDESGLITVRAPDHVHFCPIGLGSNTTPCKAPYSSGAYRFGLALADVVSSTM